MFGQERLFTAFEHVLALPGLQNSVRVAEQLLNAPCLPRYTHNISLSS